MKKNLSGAMEVLDILRVQGFMENFSEGLLEIIKLHLNFAAATLLCSGNISGSNL